MGKLIVPLIIGLLMGISGGGFFSVYKASAAHATAIADAKKHGLKPVADSTHAAEGDSTAGAEGEHVAAEPAKAAEHDATPTTVAAAPKPADATHAAPAISVPGAHATPVVTKPSTATPTTAVAATSPSGAPTEAETQAHQQRLAKIFATMGAKDASRVLTQMSDHDVGIILGLLTDRQAAAILTNLPAPRAAALSQVQLRRTGGTE